MISCLLAELERQTTLLGKSAPIRILDAGCSDGGLIAELVSALRERGNLSRRCEIYGFIPADRMSPEAASREKVVDSLVLQYPEFDWNNQISVVPLAESWPFEDRFFNIVVSSQVPEYHGDLGWYFEQSYRVLRTAGVGVHCFAASEMTMRFGIYRNLLLGLKIADSGSEPIFDGRALAQASSWKRVRQIGERVGFKVKPRYNGCLLRRLMSGEHMAYRYPRNQSDRLAIRLLAPWSHVTLISEKICGDS